MRYCSYIIFLHRFCFLAVREGYFASDNGYSYIGTQNVSISGKPCLNWLDIDPDRYGITHRLAGNFEGNQCRVSDEEHYGSIPECFVSNEEVEKCPVPVCGNMDIFLVFCFLQIRYLRAQVISVEGRITVSCPSPVFENLVFYMMFTNQCPSCHSIIRG